mgnify:CR=1 FL=1
MVREEDIRKELREFLPHLEISDKELIAYMIGLCSSEIEHLRYHIKTKRKAFEMFGQAVKEGDLEKARILSKIIGEEDSEIKRVAGIVNAVCSVPYLDYFYFEAGEG